ncbi:MAG: hypothetical protein R3F35_14870 [Myxococcota bacterium]
MPPESKTPPASVHASRSEVENAFDVFVAALEAGRTTLFEGRPDLDPIDVADGEAFLATLVEGATQFVRADPDRPVFAPWANAHRRWVDNGHDSVYWVAPVAGGRRYRVHGRRGDECYLSFTLYAGNPGHPEKTVGNWNFRDLGADAPGDAFSFELEPPPDACYVISRQYFLDPTNARPGVFTIDRLAPGSGRPDSPASDASAAGVRSGGATPTAGLATQAPPPAASALAERWRAAASFLRAMTRGTGGGTAGMKLPPYVSTEPNRMGDPSQWRESEGGGRGTPDQVYAMGPWRLEPDQALELRLRFPEAAYCSVALWNRFSQTVDPRVWRSTLNQQQAVREPDGSVKVVVAARDPGHPNWLQTGGRRSGSLFWRFLLTQSPPGKIESKRVPLPR